MTLRSVCVFCGASPALPGLPGSRRGPRPAPGRARPDPGLRWRRGRSDGHRGGRRIGRRRRSDRDHPAEPAGGRDRPQGPDPPGSGRRHARAQGTHGRTGRRLHRPAWRARHPGRAVRGLDLGPTGLPRQAAGPARSERFLRPAADFPRPPGRRTFRPRRTPRHAAARRQPGGAARCPRRLDAERGAEVVDRTRSDPLLSQDGGSRLSGSSGRPFWRISKYSCTRSASEEPASAIFWPLPTICPSFTSKRLLCA